MHLMSWTCFENWIFEMLDISREVVTITIIPLEIPRDGSIKNIH